MANLLLKNALILTMDQALTTVQRGYLQIRGDRIAALGEGEPPFPEEGYQVLDCSGKIVIPGMINTHNHLPMILFRSLGDDVADRLKRYLFPLENESLDAPMVRAGADYAFAELLFGGVTTCYDAYYFEDEVAQAAEACGIRAVLAETILEGPSPSAKEPYGEWEYTKWFVEKWKGHPRITPSVNCHAPYSNDTEHLVAAHDLARREGLLMSMHVAEMAYEHTGCLERYGLSPVAYLDSIGILDEHFLAAHSILMDEADLDIYQRRGVKVSYNAGSNAKSAKGVAKIRQMLDRGIPVSLGTDGAMSGNTIDIVTQLSLVGKIQKLFNGDRTLFPAREILQLATIGGARALGMEGEIGSLEVGKKADIAIFETDSVNMSPLYDPYSVIVYSANPGNVESTIVDGELVMHRRQLRSMDFGAVKARLLGYQEQIRQTAAELDRALAEG